MQNSFFTQLFSTTLLNLMVIILGLFVFIGFFTKNSVYNEIKKQDNEILFQVQKRMDIDMVAMRRAAHSITIDSEFTPFNLPENPWKAVLAIRYLKNYSLISDNILLIGIVYGASKYALSDKGSMTKEYFHRFSLPSYQELGDRENLKKGFIITGDRVVFIFPYPSRLDVEPQGVIFVQYPMDAFVQSLPGNFRFLTVRNTVSNTVLFSGNPVPGEEIINNKYTSPLTGYSYEISTSLSYYNAIVRRFRAQLLSAAAGLFGIGFLLNLLMARYNVLPLRRLVGKYASPDSEVNFKVIDTVLTEQLSVQSRSARDAILLKLIQGGFPSMEVLQKNFRDAGLDFPGDSFAFIIVRSGTKTSGGSPALDTAVMGNTIFYRQYQRVGENDIWVYSGHAADFTEENLERFINAAYGGDLPIRAAASSVSPDTAAAVQRFLESLTVLNRTPDQNKKIVLYGDIPEELKNGNEEAEDPPPGGGIANIVKHYVEIHFDDKMLSLELIADFLGFSVGYLCRQFKQNTGITVASYIQNLRIDEACRLLRSTDMPVKKIVETVGYMDHSGFSRKFKARHGLSPQDYRKNAVHRALT